MNKEVRENVIKFVENSTRSIVDQIVKEFPNIQEQIDISFYIIDSLHSTILTVIDPKDLDRVFKHIEQRTQNSIEMFKEMYRAKDEKTV